jgi:hypothetical protein
MDHEKWDSLKLVLGQVAYLLSAADHPELLRLPAQGQSER